MILNMTTDFEIPAQNKLTQSIFGSKFKGFFA